jgi:hypothetical protein
MSARWTTTRYPLAVEVAIVATLYATYEATRGLVASDGRLARAHAADVASLERRLQLFHEHAVQHAAEQVPGLVGILGGAYLTLHLVITCAVFLWLYRRRPQLYPTARTTLLLASGLGLAGFIAFPTAPPRLAGLGIADTVSSGHVNLDRGLIHFLYNPYAAVPSMHIAYAVIVAGAMWSSTTRAAIRAAALAYPAFVVLVIVATGNHFFLDAVAGAAVSALAFGLTRLLQRSARRSAGIAFHPDPSHPLLKGAL